MTLADISAGMLTAAKQKIEHAGLGEGVEAYVETSIFDLPFADASFDHAISLNMFNHLEHVGDALKQLARMNRPGSTLLFNYANLYSYYWPAARKINQRHRAIGRDVYSAWERPAQIRRLIDQASLDLVRQLGHVPCTCRIILRRTLFVPIVLLA